MKIWIDKDSGTWGVLHTGSLVVLDAARAGSEMDNDGGDEFTCLATLDNASDSEIIDVAQHALDYGYGEVVK